MASMAGKTEWPQSLKDFANRAFSASTDANRTAVQEELRAVIYRAYTAGTIETTDWDQVELESLSVGKKQKKRPALSGASELLADQEKKEKRARRFDRERAAFDEMEHQSTLAMGSQSGSLANRLGGVTPRMGLNQHQKQGWQYDFTGSRATNQKAPGWPAQPDRLAGRINAAVLSDSDVADPNVIDWDQDTVVGLSTKLEKPYLRLTSAPDPRNVRTLATLMQTLEMLKKKWRTEANYGYICDQFKSMRQDLTVQRIKNEFTVKVYEIHARIALENGDLGEYNQCQSQLRGLYELGLKGSVMEFLAYRILYLLHTCNRRDVNALMTELTPAHKAEPAVKHALAVRSALAIGNYHAFFRLYDDAPNMNAYIIDHFIDRERIHALLIMARCYRPSLALSFLTTELAFADVQNAHDFLARHQAALYATPSSTGSSIGVTSASNKKSKRALPSAQGIPLEARNWDAKAAQAALEQARLKFRTIGLIKSQT